MLVRVIDSSNLLMICWNVAFSKHKEYFNVLLQLEKNLENTDDPIFREIKHSIFTDYYWLLFKKFKQIYNNCDKVVFCFEGHNSTEWRKSIYPEYKGTRDYNNISWQMIKILFEKFKEICKHLPCNILFTDNCEADDCIFGAVKVESSFKENEIEVWSSDKDLIQLMNYFDNVKIFDIIKKRYQDKNIHIIENKAIVGDKSDNIKGLHKIGPKTFEKMLESQEEWDKRMTEENLKIYQKYLQIIDFRNFPYIENIISEYKTNSKYSFDEEWLKKFLEEDGLFCLSLNEFLYFLKLSRKV